MLHPDKHRSSEAEEKRAAGWFQTLQQLHETVRKHGPTVDAFVQQVVNRLEERNAGPSSPPKAPLLPSHATRYAHSAKTEEQQETDRLSVETAISILPFLQLGPTGIFPGSRPVHLSLPLTDWIKVKRARLLRKEGPELKADERDQIGEVLRALRDKGELQETIDAFKHTYVKCWLGHRPAYVTPDVCVLYGMIDTWPL